MNSVQTIFIVTYSLTVCVFLCVSEAESILPGNLWDPLPQMLCPEILVGTRLFITFY